MQQRQNPPTNSVFYTNTKTNSDARFLPRPANTNVDERDNKPNNVERSQRQTKKPKQSSFDARVDSGFRGRIIVIYKNGDPFDTGTRISLSKRQFPTWRSFLEYLNEKIRLSTGPIYKVVDRDDGKAMKAVADLDDEKSYVAVTDKYIAMDYGAQAKGDWKFTPKIPAAKTPILFSDESEHILANKKEFLFHAKPPPGVLARASRRRRRQRPRSASPRAPKPTKDSANSDTRFPANRRADSLPSNNARWNNNGQQMQQRDIKMAQGSKVASDANIFPMRSLNCGTQTQRGTSVNTVARRRSASPQATRPGKATTSNRDAYDDNDDDDSYGFRFVAPQSQSKINASSNNQRQNKRDVIQRPRSANSSVPQTGVRGKVQKQPPKPQNQAAIKQQRQPTSPIVNQRATNNNTAFNSSAYGKPIVSKRRDTLDSSSTPLRGTQKKTINSNYGRPESDEKSDEENGDFRRTKSEDDDGYQSNPRRSSNYNSFHNNGYQTKLALNGYQDADDDEDDAREMQSKLNLQQSVQSGDVYRDSPSPPKRSLSRSKMANLNSYNMAQGDRSRSPSPDVYQRGRNVDSDDDVEFRQEPSSGRGSDSPLYMSNYDSSNLRRQTAQGKADTSMLQTQQKALGTSQQFQSNQQATAKPVDATKITAAGVTMPAKTAQPTPSMPVAATKSSPAAKPLVAQEPTPSPAKKTTVKPKEQPKGLAAFAAAKR